MLAKIFHDTMRLMKTIYQLRVKAIQQHLREKNLQALLISTKANCYYLSSFTGSEGTVLVTPTNARLFVDGRYTLRAKKESALQIEAISNLKKTLVPFRSRTIAVEDQIKLRDLQKLKEKYKGVSWKGTSNIVEGVRQQKDAVELRYIRKGSKLIDDAFEYVRHLINQKDYLTEIELAQEIERYGREHGAQGIPFEPIVAWGQNSAIPHHASSMQKIGNNNFLLLDFGFTVNGYQSDFTRTLFIGKPTKKQRDLYEAVLSAQQEAISAVNVNEQAGRIDNAARRHLVRHGYGKYFTHTTGHGVGIEIHEAPTLLPRSKEILVENSVVTVEPGAYLPNKFGVRIEDMVLVGKKSKTFSRIPKNWESTILVR